MSRPPPPSVVQLCRLTPLCDVIEAPDWILDVCWLSFADTANFALSYISAHNAVTVYRVTNGVVNIVIIHNEVNSILYPLTNCLILCPAFVTPLFCVVLYWC